MNKKGANFFNNWVEYLATAVLAIGLIVSLLAGSKVMSYLIVSLCGMMFGRLWYHFKTGFKFPWLVIIVGFLLGYVIGAYYGNRLTIMVLFVISIMISYYMHNKGYIKSVEY